MTRIPDVGDPAPDFTLPSTEGPIHLSELVRDGAVLLVFYPRDRTLVCTRQLCNYRDNLSVFEDLRVQIVAIKHDDFASIRRSLKSTSFPSRSRRTWTDACASSMEHWRTSGR